MMPKQQQTPSQNHVQTVKVKSQNCSKTTSNRSPNNIIPSSQQQQHLTFPDLHYALLRVLSREPLLDIFNTPQGLQWIGCPLLKTHSMATTCCCSIFFYETIVTLVVFKVNKNVHRKHHKENPNTPTLPILFTWQGTPTQTKSLGATRFLAPSITPPKRRNQQHLPLLDWSS